MKKWTMLVALLLCALMLTPFAAAQEAYVPGKTASGLIADAWESGQIIHGDLKLRFDADAAALGLSEEEQAMLDTVLPLLDSVTLGLGAGKTEGGIRIEAGAELANAQGGDPVSVSAAANLDLFGISVESDLIPGERVTAKWETLLAMAGMSDSDISMLLMLRDMDWETMLPQVIAMAETYVQMGLEYAQPYADTIIGWAASLPMTLDVPSAPQGYPEAASRSAVTMTEKDIMTLAAALAEQLKNDQVVFNLCAGLLEESGEGTAKDLAELCDEIIAEAAACTNTEDSIRISFGADENGAPVYAVAELINDNLLQVSLGACAAANADNQPEYAFKLFVYDETSTVMGSMLFTATQTESGMTFGGEIFAQGKQVLGLVYDWKLAAIEGTLPGLKAEHSINMVVDDEGVTVQLVGSGTESATLTIDGGEVIDRTGNLDLYVDGEQLTTTALETFALYPDTEGFTGSYSVMQAMPAYGLNAVGFDVYLSDKTYDPASTAALREAALETSSQEDMESLLNAIMQNGQFKLLAAMQALPTEVLSLLMQ